MDKSEDTINKKADTYKQKKCSDCGREIKKGEWYVKTEDEIHCKLCCYDYSLESKL